MPADPKMVLPAEVDVVEEIVKWGEERMAYLARVGIPAERVIFDPGVGIGKTAAQSRVIIEKAEAFRALGVPVMIGHSRKSWLAEAHATPKERDQATLEASLRLRAKGVDYLRVHNVALHARAFAVAP
ncbi:MAG: dihydropteroate synthase [Alphaproteobacteria bacterium]|nr:dihydropteroate synthase [Alphaproteobacteria bacterium]